MHPIHGHKREERIRENASGRARTKQREMQRAAPGSRSFLEQKKTSSVSWKMKKVLHAGDTDEDDAACLRE